MIDPEDFEESPFNDEIADEGDVMGQSESKKSSKKANNGGPETKGTAISFGFRKKLHVTPKKSKNLQKHQKEMLDNNLTLQQQQSNCDEKTKQKHNFDTVIANTAEVVDKNTTTTSNTTNTQKNDKNGNAETNPTLPSTTPTTTTPTPMVTFEKVGAGKTLAYHQTKIPSVAAATPTNDNNTVTVGRSILINGGAGGGAVNRTNRFGFKGTNTVRPASTGITPRYQSDFQDNFDNNNYTQVGGGTYNNNNFNNNNNSTIKRRSKSAHTGRAMTPNLSNPHPNRQQQFDESRHQPHAPKITQKSLNYHSNEYQRSRLQFLQQQQQQQPQQYKSQTQQLSGNSSISRPATCLTNPPQYTFVNTGMHTNVIVRPTPRPPSATFSKFTLQTTSLPKPEYPVPIRLAPSSSSAGAGSSSSGLQMDQKTAKQMANNNRRGFQGSREISADSGIASLDATLAEPQPQLQQQASGSPRRNRSRPRNLQMVMSGRHKFEVRDLDDPLSSDSAVEPLALPKLPSAFSSDHQTVPLSGLIRSNTVLTREAFFRSPGSADERDSTDNGQQQQHQQEKPNKNTSDSEGLGEEKLFLDRSTSEKCAKKHHQYKELNTFSKNSSPGSSRTSWCNAGESLAVKDCSSLSISSSDESKDNQNEKTDAIMPITEDISHQSTSQIVSSISSMTESGLQLEKEPKIDDENVCDEIGIKPERPMSLTNINESKFAEMAAAVASEFLLDDETSPTDSLVSSTESEDVVCKRQKKKNNLEIQEKDIDEISPEFEVCSPLSPGTPTHASHSLSLSDCGRDFLIDDEIADQPALLFNESNESADMGAAHVAHSHAHSDTPTLMETGSMRSLKSQSKARSALQAAIELSLRTPVSLRKAVMNRAESLDTLSPCESICSDDLMMDFDVNSSMDSIEKMSASIRSRSGSALHKLDDTQMFSELEGRSNDMMKELNTILRVHNRNDKDNNMIAHLPARATRLLNRTRLQQCQLSNNGSDSPKSTDSFRRTPSRTSSVHHSQRDTNSSSDDLMLHDKSFRNAMIQDVLHFKKQLLRLRRILQETETLNPFDTNNGQLFASCGLDTKFLEDIDVASLTSSTTDDPVQELADLRRQVVYLQGQVDDRDRTIRIQKNLIDKLESDHGSLSQISSDKECVNTATQTERTRPLSIGAEGLSRIQFGQK